MLRWISTRKDGEYVTLEIWLVWKNPIDLGNARSTLEILKRSVMKFTMQLLMRDQEAKGFKQVLVE